MSKDRLQPEREIISEAVRRAGQAVRQLSSGGFETHIKKDRSPVTSADLEVNRILKETIDKHFPHDGWLSEETPDGPDRVENKRVWVIDPIDGTKYFINGVPEFTISVALVEDGRPVLGIVFNPATGEFFSAIRGSGATLNDQSMHIRKRHDPRLTLLVNPPSFQRGRFQPLGSEADFKPMGSIAYTLALVATGRADGTINLDRLSEWDVAGGVLLVEEAGGLATDSQGNPLQFNRPDPSIRGILAGSPSLHPTLQSFVERLGRR
jgi:myo-inositol-1(or 4)-monophosphatase